MSLTSIHKYRHSVGFWALKRMNGFKLLPVYLLVLAELPMLIFNKVIQMDYDVGTMIFSMLKDQK